MLEIITTPIEKLKVIIQVNNIINILDILSFEGIDNVFIGLLKVRKIKV